MDSSKQTRKLYLGVIRCGPPNWVGFNPFFAHKLMNSTLASPSALASLLKAKTITSYKAMAAMLATNPPRTHENMRVRRFISHESVLVLFQYRCGGDPPPPSHPPNFITTSPRS